MSNYFRNVGAPNLSEEQLQALSMYMSYYNQLTYHNEMLQDMLTQTREQIINILQPRGIRRPIQRTSPFSHFNAFNSNTFNSNTFNNNLRPRRDSYLSTLLNEWLNTPITVRPTQQEISNASRTIRYGNIENPISTSCPISLEDFNDDDEVVQLLPCNHIFHAEHFNSWFNSNVRCPVCRYDIRNYVRTTNTRSNTNTNTTRTNIPLDVSSNLISNVNLTRDVNTNQIDQINFDITDQEFVDQITRNMFQALLNPTNNNSNSNSNSTNRNDNILIDPSNNAFYYETIFRLNNF